MPMNPSFKTISSCLVILLALGSAARVAGPAHAAPGAPADGPAIDVSTRPLLPSAAPCTGDFAVTELDHTTTTPGDTVDHFEANGAGVALGDLDNDRDLDIVLANHAGPNTILWNLGGMAFRSERMAHGDSRAVSLVDVDGDGWLDIVFSRRTGGVSYWRSQGAAGQPGAFKLQVLPGVANPAYALAWGDLDHDNDLDLVAASYDASLLDDLGNEFLTNGGAGLWVYENRQGRFAPQPLARTSQAMAVALFDANLDGERDIVIGNDFAVPDYLWLWSEAGWQPSSFETTSHSTMSLDAGDIDNDGVFELFSSDMMPYRSDAATVAAWAPLMADMSDVAVPGDPQIMSNVLQVPTGIAGYQNAAHARGAGATGWTWSAKFGDLDQDGLLDLYAVNGMRESTMLAHLPNHELVEENQALRNVGAGQFRAAPQWGLGSTAGGRGMSMGDLDGDGDLDIVVNNLGQPAQLFENRLCSGAAVQVALDWPGSGNTRGLGAVVLLHTSAGTMSRDVRSGSGYLSGDPAQVHFGVPAIARIESVEIRWPDGQVSFVQPVQRQTQLTVTRLAGSAAQESPAAAASVPGTSTLDAALRGQIAQHRLTGDPSTGRNLPNIEDALAQLGMGLFFTKALGGNQNSACVTCHHPLLGGGDGLPLSIGVDADDPDRLGPGRTHPSGRFNVPRNALTTFNIGLWDQALFFDGRVEGMGKTAGKNGDDGLGIRTPDCLLGDADPLSGLNLVIAQARFPVTSLDEMRGRTFEAHNPNEFVRMALAQRLADGGWLPEFQRAFGSTADAKTLITPATVAEALGAYERSQVFVDTPWRAYVQGDDAAIDDAAKRGALLFYQPVAGGGAGCAQCHSGDFFTDEQFYTLAIPQIGRGKGDGLWHDDDFGRFRETGQPQDLYAFRTPTLLNVAVTGPYGHDGAYTTLEGIVRHHLDPAAAVQAFDYAAVDPAASTAHSALNTARALAKLAADRAAGRTPLHDVALSDAQVGDLVSFLRALTDPCVQDAACLAAWIPGADDPNPDGLRVEAKIVR